MIKAMVNPIAALTVNLLRGTGFTTSVVINVSQKKELTPALTTILLHRKTALSLPFHVKHKNPECLV
jgi:hypothetical protein